MNKNVALITGSSSGIGAAAAELFAQHEYHVIVTGRDAQRAQEVCEHIRSAGSGADYFVADLTQEAEINKLIEFSTSIGNITAFVNCSGGNKRDMSPQEHLAINYISPRFVMEKVSEHMLEGSSIITVTSICSESKQAHEGGPYSDAKAALTSYSMGLAKRLAQRSIRVNIVAPGLTDTRDTVHISQAKRIALAEKMPLTGRFLTPQEVAEVIYTLSALNVTGQTLVVDGGMTVVHG